jgi:3-oxoacyl-[acyl-carrier-protein] synthase-3
MRAVITGTGMYVPPHIVDNQRLSRIMDTSDEWIQKRTGIVTRHYAERGKATSDMAVPAAEMALADAGIGKDAIDYVVFATMTPDHYFPGSGNIFQHKLGLGTVPCIDLRAQCTGFLYGMQLADAMIRSGQYRNILVVGAEVHSAFMPWKAWDILLDGADREFPADEYAYVSRFRDRTVLFGDGAGAFVISAIEEGEAGVESICIHSDGQYKEKMWVKAGGSAYRPYFEPEMHESGDIVPIVVGREVFKLAVTLMPEAVNEILDANGYALDDIRLLIMHQANLRINEGVQKRLGLSDEKVYNNIQKYGNTTAGTLPIAFHEARQACGLRPGDLVCFVALGGGVNWGSMLYRC